MSSGIQAEIRQRKAFSSREEEAYVALIRTADRLQWQVAEKLKPHGLPLTQYNALRILRGAGRQGLACSEIGARMIQHDPDVTRLLNRLERRGLIRRSRDAKDRRIIKARISSRGRELLERIDPEVDKFLGELLGHLGPQQLESLIALLQAVRDLQSPKLS